MVLLEGVKSLEFRYMDEKEKWYGAWPAEAFNPVTGAKDPWKPPVAVAVQVETQRFGKVERWFRVPGAIQ